LRWCAKCGSGASLKSSRLFGRSNTFSRTRSDFSRIKGCDLSVPLSVVEYGFHLILRRRSGAADLDRLPVPPPRYPAHPTDRQATSFARLPESIPPLRTRAQLTHVLRVSGTLPTRR